MGKIFWSVDEKKYNDRNAHTLTISGWAADTDQKKGRFALYGNGAEIPCSEPLR